jgi:glutamine amidotransferase
MLGVSANKEVDIRLSLREFKHRGRTNSHGWGFAFFKNGWEIIKKPESLFEENISDEIFNFKSSIIIGHVRLASCGNQIHENTHPFKIGNWVFAHNGTVTAVKKLPLKKYKPAGDTDSEYAFCYLLEKIEQTPGDIEETIAREAGRIKEYGNFNFLTSDGKKLYAYGHSSLFYVQREAPFPLVELRDEQFEINLTDIKSPGERAIIVATQPLTTNEKWIKITGLKVFEDGRLKEV